jgi:hypothetical protein
MTSKAVLHHCTAFGFLCALWVYYGAAEDAEIYSRLLTPDLYLLMFALCALYRLLLKRTMDRDGNIDFKMMGLYIVGDTMHAALAMVCITFFFLSLSVGDMSATTKFTGAHL